MKKNEFLENIIKEIETRKTLPWVKPWNGRFLNFPNQPHNAESGNIYRGINAFYLSIFRFDTPRFVTYQQAKKLGGNVKKGERGFKVCYFNILNKEEKDKHGNTETKEIPFLKIYTVFNESQCEGLNLPEPEIEPQLKEFSRIKNAEMLIDHWIYKPKIEIEKINRAYYNSYKDLVRVPTPEQFQSKESYYNVLFHELAHSTGHETRLKRKMSSEFASESYSLEELIAEMTACLLANECGFIEKVKDNSITYLQGWLKVLKNDPNMLLKAASAAQKAADLIIHNKK